MNSKLLLGLVLVLSGILSSCSRNADTSSPGNGSASPPGKLLEIHTFKAHPAVEIYMQGFQDMEFNAYLKDGGSEQLLFRSLPAMKSQFENTTNIISRANHAQRTCANPNGVGMYDVYWSKDFQRLAIAFEGNFIAGYDCKTGQKIQTKEGIDSKSQCSAIDAVIQGFLDGKDFTEAEVADVRRHSYSRQQHQLNP